MFGKKRQKASGELIDVIEWKDRATNNIAWRYPRYMEEINSGAQLIVRKNQVAVLAHEGEFADVYEPGKYQLYTNNMPVLSKVKKWKEDFKLPFKADVYFVNTKQYLNLDWSTTSPIFMSDSQFGLIRIGASGSYCFQLEPNPTKFIRNVADTHRNFTDKNIQEQLLNFVIAKFSDYLADSKITVLDLATNLNEFSSELTIALKEDFSEYGIGLTHFSVENISLPQAVEEALKEYRA